ncbi:MAG: radical SAM protein [Bacteroidetes bacterium]|nr:radical SAM protein [Bacteroidota bacterium]MBU1718905.1 radical SAM protein [Bacteroidota bacterium]
MKLPIFRSENNKNAPAWLAEYNTGRAKTDRQYVCQAPFRALRFSQSGNIYFCCHNRFYSLGKYPEISLQEAWGGEKANKFREMIKSFDLSGGCHNCRTHLENRNFASAGTTVYDNLSKGNPEFPVMMDFEISNLCNLECAMCSGENSSMIRRNREGKEPYPMRYDENFADQLSHFIPHLHEARFVGGEPFLIDLYYQIWERISTINPAVSIQILTNGTVLNQKIIDFVENNNVHVSFSLDSVVKETYQAIRQNANYEQVFANLETIREISQRKSRNISVNICAIRQNRMEIPEMLRYFSEKKIAVIFHIVHYPPAHALWGLTYPELAELAAFYKNSALELRGNIPQADMNRFLGLMKQVEIWRNKAKMEQEEILPEEEELWKELYNQIVRHFQKAEGVDVVHLSDKYSVRLQAIADMVDDRMLVRRALRNLRGIPIGMLIAELETGSDEVLLERFIAIAN